MDGGSFYALWELLAAVVALFVGILALVRFYTKQNNTILFIGTGFVGAGFLDAYHAITTSVYLQQALPLAGGATWSWNASRSFLAILIFGSWLAWRREAEPAETDQRQRRLIGALVVLVSVFAILLLALWPFAPLDSPAPTTISRIEVAVSTTFFLAALAGYLYKWQVAGGEEPFYHWLVASLILSLVGQLGLMLFSGAAFDPMFRAANLFKMASYLAMLAGLLVSMHAIFRSAEKSAAELEVERALLAERVAERTADLRTANAELARAMQLKDEFLANMSHELRTPLNAVLGMSEALQEGILGPLNEQQQRTLRTIEESGRHLLSLINDILDLSKVEAGKLELEIRPVSLPSVCESSLRLIQQEASNKRLAVHTAVDESVPIIQADERRLKQILVNLLGNAVKFTPAGGAIGLEVAADVEREAVNITVWDTGIGIGAEDVARLFRPFVQLDSRLARHYAGTGLGLSLVYRLTELHHGGVSLQSELGRGSRFTVSLPVSVTG